MCHPSTQRLEYAPWTSPGVGLDPWAGGVTVTEQPEEKQVGESALDVSGRQLSNS